VSKKKPLTDGIVFSTDPSYKPTEDPGELQETLPPSRQPLRIRLETKQRGGKVVTVVYGFIGNDGDLEALGKQIKAVCGTGGTVKDQEILIQGDHRQKILQWLKKNGYSASK
jgi:translation initiation factor 1